MISLSVWILLVWALDTQLFIWGEIRLSISLFVPHFNMWQRHFLSLYMRIPSDIIFRSVGEDIKFETFVCS